MLRRKISIHLLILVFLFLLTACSGGGNISSKQRADVHRVELVSVGSFPTKYFAVATGRLPDGCSKSGRSAQRLSGKTLVVTLYVDTPAGTCAFPHNQPFKETIPLDIRELGTGSYRVEVNGVFSSEKIPIGQKTIQ